MRLNLMSVGMGTSVWVNSEIVTETNRGIARLQQTLRPWQSIRPTKRPHFCGLIAFYPALKRLRSMGRLVVVLRSETGLLHHFGGVVFHHLLDAFADHQALDRDHYG